MKQKIKLNIGNRIYPLNVNIEQEEVLRKAAKEINEMIIKYEKSYAVKDKQDSLAMCALEIFTNNKKIPSKIVSDSNDENLISEDNYTNNETRIQENFSFEKNITPSDKKIIKYKLPAIDFLKAPTKCCPELSGYADGKFSDGRPAGRLCCRGVGAPARPRRAGSRSSGPA